VVEGQPSGRTILAGTVSRDDLTAVTMRHPSARMKLKLMGIRYEAPKEVVYSHHPESRAARR
jgi:hypothetical protein